MPEMVMGGENAENTGMRPWDQLERIAILGIFALLFVLAYTRNVNWDEFYFLSHVHTFLDGRLDRPMQTFFVHGFGWLEYVPGNEMQQIFAARLLMVGFLAVTSFSIHRIAAHFTDRRSASVAVLAYLTSAFVLSHGASFRADPIAAAFLTSSIAILFTTRMSALHMVSAAVLSALAALVTIKAALYLPAYLAVLVWRKDERGVVLRIIGSGILAAVLFVVLYLWHASGIVAAEGNETSANARNALSTTLLQSGLFPRSRETIGWALFSIPQIILATMGLFAKRDIRLAIVLLLFAAPLFSIVIYRNAFDYFFPFAVPLLMVAVAVQAQNMRKSALLPQLVVIMLIFYGVQIARVLPENANTQRATVAEVHRLFKEPVPYIDDSHMIASFPSVAFFMSSWGVDKYRAKLQPVFADIIERTQPPLLIANKITLMRTMNTELPEPVPAILLPEDHDVLRETYVHYAGAIWLAGRQVTLTDDPTSVRVPFPGQYRIESEQPVQIDNQPVTTGMVLELDGTPVVVVGPPGVTVKLIWDTGVEPIRADDLGRDVYVGFRMITL